jgi:hypothetical protein
LPTRPGYDGYALGRREQANIVPDYRNAELVLLVACDDLTGFILGCVDGWPARQFEALSGTSPVDETDCSWQFTHKSEFSCSAIMNFDFTRAMFYGYPVCTRLGARRGVRL